MKPSIYYVIQMDGTGVWNKLDKSIASMWIISMHHNWNKAQPLTAFSPNMTVTVIYRVQSYLFRENLIGYYWHSTVNIGKNQTKKHFAFYFQMKLLHLSYFFLFKLEIETNLSNFEEKIIFEGFFDSRLKMKLPTQKKFQMEKVVQKFTRKTRSRLRAFLRARGLSLKAFQRWLNFFGSSFKSRFLCLCDYDTQQ